MGGYETDDSDTTVDATDSGRRRRRRRHPRRHSDRRHRSSSDQTRSRREPGNDRSTAQTNGLESDSDATIDLPDRFDRNGRLLPQPDDDPLADRVENLLKRFNRTFA